MEEFVVIVCGGRFYSDKPYLFEVLDKLYASLPEDTMLHIVEGGADGADSYARQWAYRGRKRKLRVKNTTVEAEWRQYGKAAGPIRNTQMLDKYPPRFVLAFPGHKGTRDMINQATDRGIKVVKTKDWSLYEDDYVYTDEILVGGGDA